MRDNKTKKAPSKEELRKLKVQLQALHPELKKLKVKKYYNQGKVRAFASIGTRRVHVRTTAAKIVGAFTAQFLERLPTAF